MVHQTTNKVSLLIRLPTCQIRTRVIAMLSKTIKTPSIHDMTHDNRSIQQHIDTQMHLLAFGCLQMVFQTHTGIPLNLENRQLPLELIATNTMAVLDSVLALEGSAPCNSGPKRLRFQEETRANKTEATRKSRHNRPNRILKQHTNKNARMEVRNASVRCRALRHCPVAASSAEQSVPARSRNLSKQPRS
jgi:hypothetical protein